MVPSSVANRKIDAAEAAVPVFEKPLTLKPPALPVLTAPVGAPLAPRGFGGVGMLTTSPSFAPVEL